MRYLFAVMADPNGQVDADAAEMAAINAFNDKMTAAGQNVMAAGVATPDRATVIDNRHGQGLVRNGPAVSGELFMAGFWIVEASGDEEAHGLAIEASLACNRVIEVRPFL